MLKFINKITLLLLKILNIKSLHRKIISLTFSLYLFVSNPVYYIKNLLKFFLISFKNLRYLSILNWIKLVIKFITYLNAIFGFTVLIYFDQNLIFNILENVINWFKSLKYDFYEVLYNYYQNFLKLIKKYIDSLIDKSNIPSMENKSNYPSTDKNNDNILNKDVNSDLVEKSEYKYNKNEELTNYQKFFSESNDNLAATDKSDNYSIIYSPYFYIPGLIILTASGGYLIYYYFNYDYLSSLPFLGYILKKDSNLDDNNDNLPNYEPLIKFNSDWTTNNSPVESVSSDSSNKTISATNFNKYFKDIETSLKNDEKNPVKYIDPWNNNND